MKQSVIAALAFCLIASFSSCGNQQPKAAESTDSTSTADSVVAKDTVVTEKVEPKVDSTKIFSDVVAQRGEMVYKATHQVEDDIVYDDERDFGPKNTFTESLRFTFKSNGKVNIKVATQDDASWSGTWEANGYDVTVSAQGMTVNGTVSEDFKTFKLSSGSTSKLYWAGPRKLKLQ